MNKFLFPSKINAKNILIYSDRGVSPYSALGLSLRLKHLLKESPYQVTLVNSDYIKNEPWESKTVLLIMPGGRARPYYNSLGASWKINYVSKGEMRGLEDAGSGNQRIHDFVAKAGGKFLGVCAGAYYAAEKTVFEKGGDLEVIDEGPLKFFSGLAEGPAYGLRKFSYHSIHGAQLAEVLWEEPSQEESEQKVGFAYYNGGCFFHQPDGRTDYKILARYNDIIDKPAAVIECQLNRGTAILSGVHFETSHQFFPFLSMKSPLFYNGLKKNESFQMNSLRRILKRLDIIEQGKDQNSHP